jgi:uncharacterized protein YoaH (UPF0181 family)
MATTKTQTTVEQERAQALMAMGFSATQAFLLAATQRGGEHVELERVQGLLDAGCAHEVAVRILL